MDKKPTYKEIITEMKKIDEELEKLHNRGLTLTARYDELDRQLRSMK